MNNIEFVNRAREILNQDYNTRRKAEYSVWLDGCKNSWRQPHVIVPFPPFIISGGALPFTPVTTAPTEESVASKALELYNQFHGINTTAVAATPLITEITHSPVVAREIEPVVLANVEPAALLSVEPVVEPVVQSGVEPVLAEPAIESAIEPATVPAAIPTLYTDDIYKIFETPPEKITELDSTDPLLKTIEADLNAVPQPAEELAKLSKSTKKKPSVLERLQNMTGKWSAGNKDV